MLNLSDLVELMFSPRLWFSWFNGNQQIVQYDVVGDQCLKCNRFLSLHSDGNMYCSYHNVNWNHVDLVERSTFHLFRGAFEMWLRSRCGGDLDEVEIASDLLTMKSYLSYVVVASPPESNLYDYCDQVFANYQLLHEFLESIQSKDKENGSSNKDTTVDLQICRGLHRFIEFRKYQLPVKGIIENMYSASELVLKSYQKKILDGTSQNILNVYPLTRCDVDITISHFLPQYHMIIDYFTIRNELRKDRSLENGADFKFTTSFLALFLYSYMPEHWNTLNLIRVRDLGLTPDSSPATEYSTERYGLTEVNKFVSSNSDIASPIEASACTGQLQKLLTLDERVRSIVLPYIEIIRPRISKVNDYLLLSDGLGMDAGQIEQAMSTLIFRVTGRIPVLTHTLSLPREMPSVSAIKQKRSRSLTPSRLRVIRKALPGSKILKRYRKQKMRPKNLILKLNSTL